MRAIDPVIDRLSLISQHLQHPGEKGKLAELALSQWLSAFLPKKYSVSTGFVAASDGEKLLLSPQRDIIIYDTLYSSPIWESEIGGIYPIECVYATIEVKTNLKKGSHGEKARELFKAMKDAHVINDMGKYKSYLNRNTINTGVEFIEERGTIPPRNYIIAYTTSISTITKFIDMATEVVKKSSDYDTHCHGILILDRKKDWFIQRPHGNSDDAKNGLIFYHMEGSGWDAFCRELLLQLESMDVNDRLHFAGQIINSLIYPIT